MNCLLKGASHVDVWDTKTKYTYVFDTTTCCIFLGFWFLVRNEEKNEIPREERGKFEEFPDLLFNLKGAPNLSKKCTKKAHKFFFFYQKAPYFLVKGTQFFTPKNFFIAFLGINFFSDQILQFCFSIFYVFFYIFP